MDASRCNNDTSPNFTRQHRTYFLHLPASYIVTHKYHQDSRITRHQKNKISHRSITLEKNSFGTTQTQQADLRSRTPKDLRSPRVREQTDNAGEKAGEKHDHTDADAGTLVRDGG